MTGARSIYLFCVSAVEYDDGDEEWLDLTQERHKLLPAEVPGAPAAAARKKHRKAVIVSDSDDDDDNGVNDDEGDDSDFEGEGQQGMAPVQWGVVEPALSWPAISNGQQQSQQLCPLLSVA